LKEKESYQEKKRGKTAHLKDNLRAAVKGGTRSMKKRLFERRYQRELTRRKSLYSILGGKTNPTLVSRGLLNKLHHHRRGGKDELVSLI